MSPLVRTDGAAAPRSSGNVGRTLPVRALGTAFIVFICASLIGGEGWRAWSERERQLAATRLTATNLADSVAQHAEGAFDVADTILYDAVERMEADGAGPEALSRLHRLLVTRMAALPRLHQVVVIGQDGGLLTSSQAGQPDAAAPSGLGSAGPDLVAYHRLHAEPGPRVGALLRNADHGGFSVMLSRRFDHADGSFAGAVAAELDGDYFVEFYRGLMVSEHTSVSLWRDDGPLLVRYPIPDHIPPINLHDIDTVRAHALSSPRGAFEAVSIIDGQPRIYAHQHLRRFPVVVFNGVSSADALADWRAETRNHAAILALILAVFVLGGWRVLLQVARTREAELAYRLLADHCADVIFTLDLAYRCEYITPSVLDRTGYTPAALIGARLMHYVHPDDRPAVGAVYQAVAAGQERAMVSHRLRHAAGHWLWVEVELRLVREPRSNAPSEIIGASRDVSARKAAEDSLQAERAFLQAVFEHTTDCLFVQRVLPGGGFAIERINSAAANSLGIEAEEAVGRSPQSLFGEVYGDVVEAGLRHTLAARQALWLEDQGVDGVTWEVIEVPIPGAGGAIERILVNARDVSEQKRVQEAELLLRASEEQRRLAAEATSERLDRLARHLARARDRAEQANQAKTRFLTSMSHELRTPLNGVLGYAQLLRMEGGLNARQTDHVDSMVAAGRHLLEMITSVLDMGQIEADKITLQSAEVNLPDLAHACLGLVRPVAESKGLTLRFEAEAGAPSSLRADPVRLRQVLLNLLGNAVKFTSVGQVAVRLRWTADQDTVRIEVADTGPGIPERQRERLFEAFERMDDADTAATEGAGLGLAISTRLVAAMEGTIGCDAGPDGVGSVFWVELPAPPAPPDSATPALATTGNGASLRLLVVDDISNNRDIACAFLRSGGHRVASADGGEAAVRAVAAEDFDVVLMDVRMPDVDGLEATRRIRKLPAPRGQVPIIALTAQAFGEQIDRCREAGMDHHLPKPFELRGLLNAVAAAAGLVRPPPAEASLVTDLPGVVLDRAVFDETASYLPAGEVDEHLRALAARARALLAALEDDTAAADTADLAHAMAGAAGTFGFLKIADVGRRFEHAVEIGAPDQAVLAAELVATARATLAALAGMIQARVGAPA